MGLFDDVLPTHRTATVVPTTKGHLFDDVAVAPATRGAFGLGTAVRALATAPLDAPLAINRLLTSELVRLGQASQRIPSFQDVAPALGEIVRRPAQLLGLPTELTAGVGLGTPVNPLVRGVEQEAQNRLLAATADVGVIQSVPSAVGAVGRGITRLGVTGRVQQALRSRRILQAPIEELVQRARRSGTDAADILGTLRRAGSKKFQPVFEALEQQRQAPRRPLALLTSQRGAVPLPDIRPGDFVRFGNQVRKVASINPQTQKAVLVVGAGKTITAPLAKLAKMPSGGTVFEQLPIEAGWEPGDHSPDRVGEQFSGAIPYQQRVIDGTRWYRWISSSGKIVESRDMLLVPLRASVSRLLRDMTDSHLAAVEAAGMEAPPVGQEGNPDWDPTPGQREVYKAEMTRRMAALGYRRGEEGRWVAGQSPEAVPGPPGYGIISEGGPRDVQPAPIRRELAGVPPSPAVSHTDLTQTHPGITQVPRNPSAPEVRVVPITRQEADRLWRQSVELRPGLTIPQVFRQVPPEASQTATGLQYWYKYDLPPSRGLRYPSRTFPTPSEGFEVREPLRPLTRVRQQAIQAVTRDLAEQSRILSTESLSLKRRVLEAGGIKPTLAGGLEEELRAIRPFLRRGGQAIDDLATKLGFEDGESLRQALITAQQAKRPTLPQLRQQAIQIVDSEGGSRILQALQTKGVTGQAIRRVVREVTRQTESEVSRGLRQVRGLLRGAERKALTPVQIARVAREQRITPEATVPGPRGGEREAPLTPEEIAQVERRIGGIVPRPGQPTGTPPILPTGRALIPSDVPRPVRDLNQFQSTPFSGLDPSRAAELIDGKANGPTWQQVVHPLRQGELVVRQEQDHTLQQLRRVSLNLKERGPESRQVFEFLEGRLPAESMTLRARTTAQWMAQQFDQLLERVNQARESIGKRPILRRTGYITHLKNPSLWEELREVFTNAPADATKTLETAFFQMLGARTPGFRFGLPRRGGPFELDAIRAFKAYLPAALRVIHLSVPSRLATVYANQNLAGVPNAQSYFSQLIRQVATGEPGPIARLTPGAILRATNWLRRRFGKGTVLGNFSSVLQQPFTLPATISASGTDASTAAAAWLARGDGQSFALKWSPTVQARVLQNDVDLSDLVSRQDAVMGAMFRAADRTMVAHAFLSGYLSAVKRGAGFPEAVQVGERIALRTQAGFLEADLAPVFRDAVTGSFMQFQTTINGVFNFIKFDIPRQKNPLWGAAAFVGTLAAMVTIYEALGLPYPDRIEEFIPGLSTMRSGGPIGVRLMHSLSNLGSPSALERSKAFSTLSSSSFALVLGSGGNQIRKSFEGFKAARAGGKLDKRGRVVFPVRGLPEQARAVAFGPYGTKAGRAYLRRGFKPAPKRFPLTTPVLNGGEAVPTTGRFRVLQGGQKPPRGRLFEDVLSGGGPSR